MRRRSTCWGTAAVSADVVCAIIILLCYKVPRQPNAGAHLLPEAGATQERTLEAVRCSALFGAGPDRGSVPGLSPLCWARHTASDPRVRWQAARRRPPADVPPAAGYGSF